MNRYLRKLLILIAIIIRTLYRKYKIKKNEKLSEELNKKSDSEQS